MKRCIAIKLRDGRVVYARAISISGKALDFTYALRNPDAHGSRSFVYLNEVEMIVIWSEDHYPKTWK